MLKIYVYIYSECKNMKYAQIRKYDVANGVGIRTTLFVSGCHFNCKDCFNKEYQNFEYGKEFTDTVMQDFISLGEDENIAGYSFLGGEPLDQTQDNTLLKTLQKIKSTNKKSVWLWSGHIFETLNTKQKEIIKYVDVLVDGPFISEQKNMKLLFRGSENQRIIDVQQSLLQNKVVLWEK